MRKPWVNVQRRSIFIGGLFRRNFFNVVLFVVFVTVLLSLVFLVVLPQTGEARRINDRFLNVSNVFSFLSTVYAALAFIIAFAAYKTAVQHPELHVRLLPRMCESLTLYVTPARQVPVGKSAQWKVMIENTGAISARFTIVQLVFNGIVFSQDAFPGWDKVMHANAAGWNGIRWSAGVNGIVHPNFPLEVPELHFGGTNVISTNPEVIVTVAADGFKPLRTTYAIELICTE